MLQSAHAQLSITPGCSIRLYVYEQYEPLLEAILRVGRQMFTLHEPGRRLVSNATCFEHEPCQYSDFANATPRVFTGEVPIYQRLVQRCRRVTDPSQADLFVVPVPLSSLQVLSWGMGSFLPAKCVAPELVGWTATAIRAAEALPRSKNRTEETLRKHSQRCRERLKGQALQLVQLATRLFRRHGLPLLSPRTAPRHLFLFSNDVQFVPLQMMARDWLNETAITPLLMRSLVVHLGDDSSTVGPRSRTQKQPGRYLYNDLTVCRPWSSDPRLAPLPSASAGSAAHTFAPRPPRGSRCRTASVSGWRSGGRRQCCRSGSSSAGTSTARSHATEGSCCGPCASRRRSSGS